MSWLAQQHVAHRGLHCESAHYPENSLPAFEKACKAGYAIELDVRLTRDHRVVVIHDKNTKRISSRDANVATTSLVELTQMRLLGTDHHIPSLQEALEVIAGQVPIYIELKIDKDTNYKRLVAGIRHALEGYGGPVALMSFDPRTMIFIRQKFPKFSRGFVVGDVSLKKWWQPLMAPWILHRIHPDFIACETTLLNHPLLNRWRQQGKPILTWTVDSEEKQIHCDPLSNALIFENITPPLSA